RYLRWGQDNVLAVEVDSTERADIPPFGKNIDYLTFGGIYREVWLRAVPNVYFENMFAKSMDVQSDKRRVDVECFLGQPATETPGALKLRVELRDSGKVLASETQDVKVSQGGSHLVSLTKLGNIELWGLENPKLYRVSAQLYAGETLVD